MIYLEFAIEQPLFNRLVDNPGTIKVLPEETYNRFFKFMLQEELYEYIPKLESIRDRLIPETLDEYIKGLEDSLEWTEL